MRSWNRAADWLRPTLRRSELLCVDGISTESIGAIAPRPKAYGATPPQAFDSCRIFCSSRTSKFLHLGVWFNLNASKLDQHFACILYVQTVQ